MRIGALRLSCRNDCDESRRIHGIGGDVMDERHALHGHPLLVDRVAAVTPNYDADHRHDHAWKIARETSAQANQRDGAAGKRRVCGVVGQRQQGESK